MTEKHARCTCVMSVRSECHGSCTAGGPNKDQIILWDVLLICLSFVLVAHIFLHKDPYTDKDTDISCTVKKYYPNMI